MQIVSLGDNLHELWKPIFWKNKKKRYFKMSADFLPRLLSVKSLVFINISNICQMYCSATKLVGKYATVRFPSVQLQSETVRIVRDTFYNLPSGTSCFLILCITHILLDTATHFISTYISRKVIKSFGLQCRHSYNVTLPPGISEIESFVIENRM